MRRVFYLLKLAIKHPEIFNLLEKYSVPIDTWGTGETKTLEHLLREADKGDSTLVEYEGMLLRSERGVIINVYFQDESGLYKLFEEAQVFSDGRVRNRNLSSSIGEKMKPTESPIEATQRALEEELGINMTPDEFDLNLLEFSVEDVSPVSSTSFPGLWTKRFLYITDIYLPEKFFRPEGYVENQSDKSSYFVWRKVD